MPAIFWLFSPFNTYDAVVVRERLIDSVLLPGAEKLNLVRWLFVHNSWRGTVVGPAGSSDLVQGDCFVVGNDVVVEEVSNNE